jgi:hypothetical protein
VVFLSRLIASIMMFVGAIFSGAPGTFHPSVSMPGTATDTAPSAQVSALSTMAVHSQPTQTDASSTSERSPSSATSTIIETYYPGVGVAFVLTTKARIAVPWVQLQSAMIGTGPCADPAPPNVVCGYASWTNYSMAKDSLGNPLSLQYCFDNVCNNLPLSDLTSVLVASSTNISKDPSGVYLNYQYDHVPIAGADPETFNLYDVGFDGFAVDKNHVYDGVGDVMPGYDPATFTVLGGFFSDVDGGAELEFDEDKNGIYFPGGLSFSGSPEKIAGADLDTFEIGTNGLYATDAHHTYCVVYSAAKGDFRLDVLTEVDPSACPSTW